MRDILITLIVIVGCSYTIKRPYVGILLWSWLGYMNPHRLAYGFAYSMPFAQIVALLLFSVMFFSRETKKIPINIITILWFLYILYMGLTTYFAFFPDDALDQYVKVIKIQLVVLITMMLITDIKKLNELVWVIVLSIGYFSVKGGIFTILTGGGDRVYGPPDSFISGNNELAVATLMIIPLMVYLHHIAEKEWIKKGLLFSIVMSFVSALGTQSRGALLAFGAVALFLWFKSDKKIVLGMGMFVLTLAILAFMPASWYSRMETIQTYDEDASAMGRLNAWEYAYNAANDNFLGMGYESWTPITFSIYAPNPNDVHAAHSIYFSVLGDHGWVGLLLFLLILALSWKKMKRVIKETENNKQFENVNFLTKMIQVSFIAYLVGGAFLSLSYFDLPWHLIAFVIIIENNYKNMTDMANKSYSVDKVS